MYIVLERLEGHMNTDKQRDKFCLANILRNEERDFRILRRSDPVKVDRG